MCYFSAKQMVFLLLLTKLIIFIHHFRSKNML